MTGSGFQTKTYVASYVALMVLLILSLGFSFVPLGPLSLSVAIGISVAKALIVMAYFMHLRISTSLTRFMAGAGFFWLAILIVLTLSDYLTRGP